MLCSLSKSSCQNREYSGRPFFSEEDSGTESCNSLQSAASQGRKNKQPPCTELPPRLGKGMDRASRVSARESRPRPRTFAAAPAESEGEGKDYLEDQRRARGEELSEYGGQAMDWRASREAASACSGRGRMPESQDGAGDPAPPPCRHPCDLPDSHHRLLLSPPLLAALRLFPCVQRLLRVSNARHRRAPVLAGCRRPRRLPSVATAQKRKK